jgi:hypothetical protein
MAVQFMNMPAAKYPDNAQLDLASLARPLFQGLNQYSQGVNNAAILDQDKQIGQTAAAQGPAAASREAYGVGRLDEGQKFAQQGQQQQDALRKRYGALAQQVDMEADPARRSAMWQGTLERMKREGAALGLQGEYDPEEMDPATGPKLFMAQAGLVNDPLERQSKQADIGLKNAQANYYQQKPLGVGGATDAVAQKLMQADPNLSYLDAITLAKKGDVESVKAAEARGEDRGKAQTDLSRINDNAGLALKTIDSIKAHPGKKNGLGWTALSGYIPNSNERGFANLVDQAKGQTFLEAFNSLRGGGQITEAEGAKATQALARLDRYQSQEDFDAALGDLETVIKAGLDRAQRRAGGTAAPSSINRTFNWTPDGGLQEAK